MFPGYNVLDTPKQHDILNDIQENEFLSFSHTENLILDTNGESELDPNFRAANKEHQDTKTNTTSNEDDIALLNAIFAYARENIALVNIYIKPPVVTRILRDQRTPIIWYALQTNVTKTNQIIRFRTTTIDKHTFKI